MALKPLLQLLEEHIKAISREELAFHHNDLLNFFCRALDLRNDDNLVRLCAAALPSPSGYCYSMFSVSLQSLTSDELQSVELQSQAAVMSMVLRLSESAFRPMFYKVHLLTLIINQELTCLAMDSMPNLFAAL